MTEPTETTQELPEIWQALIAAQAAVEPVQHDSKMEYGRSYTYASAEAVIKTAKTALLAHGLAIFTESTSLKIKSRCEWGLDDRARSVVTKPGLGVLYVDYVLAHESGKCHRSRYEWPFSVQQGRPWDKSLAAAQTNCLAYYLRDLLLIERPGAADDMNTRDDSRAQRANSKPRQTPASPVKLQTGSRAERIAKLSPEGIRDKVLTGSQQIMALEPSNEQAEQLVEITQGDYTGDMLAKVWELFDKVKGRAEQIADVSLF